MEKKIVVEQREIKKIYIEVSLDGKRAGLILQDKKGKNYTLKVPDHINNRWENVSIMEL